MKRYHQLRALSLAALVILATYNHSASAQAGGSCKPTDDCPSYEDNAPQNFEKGSEVMVVVPTGLSTDLQNAVLGGIERAGVVAANSGAGNTFSLSNSIPATGGYVVVSFDTVAPVSMVGQTQPYLASPGIVSNADTTIYLNAQRGPGLPAFDQGASAQFVDAVSGVIAHELAHTLGLGDTTLAMSGSLMGNFIGSNNQYGQRTPTPCDSKATQRERNRRETGNSCQAGA